jgi:hypothetical protein
MSPFRDLLNAAATPWIRVGPDLVRSARLPRHAGDPLGRIRLLRGDGAPRGSVAGCWRSRLRGSRRGSRRILSRISRASSVTTVPANAAVERISWPGGLRCVSELGDAAGSFGRGGTGQIGLLVAWLEFGQEAGRPYLRGGRAAVDLRRRRSLSYALSCCSWPGAMKASSTSKTPVESMSTRNTRSDR